MTLKLTYEKITLVEKHMLRSTTIHNDFSPQILGFKVVDLDKSGT